MAEMDYSRTELEQKVLDGADKDVYLKAMETAADARRRILSKGISTGELEEALAVMEDLRVKVYARKAAARVQVKKTVKKPVRKVIKNEANETIAE